MVETPIEVQGLDTHEERKRAPEEKGNVVARFCTYYMDEAVFQLPEVLEKAQKELADVDFDTLVGTGFSGGIIIPALALAMGKKFVLIRKETDDSHHGKGELLGDLGRRWIFVDDFIGSGRTRDRVISKIQEAAEKRNMLTEMVGQYMYVERIWGGGFFCPFDPAWVYE